MKVHDELRKVKFVSLYSFFVRSLYIAIVKKVFVAALISI